MINEIENKIKKLNTHKDKWRSISEKEKISYLKICMNNLMQIKNQWVNLCVEAKKIPKNSQIQGQEWLTGPVTLMRAFRVLKYSLEQNAQPKIKISEHDSRFVAKVVPINFYESVLYSGLSAHLLLQKGKPRTQGHHYQALKNKPGNLCAVLGAGNVASMPALDILHKLFLEGSVCLLKFNPINEYLEEVFAFIFAPFIENGFLDLIKGDKDVGQSICGHELIDEIHVTGSFETYKAIAKYNKKITAELGCVSPAIIVPGKWSLKAIKVQAKQIASAIENNASFNCNATKVLVLSKNWEQKNQFLDALRNEFSKIPLRYAYYPGAQERYQKFLDKYPQAEKFENDKTPDTIPWTLIPNVPIKPNEYALNIEAFCGVLAVIELDSDGAESFISESVDTCNNSIWGNLSCTFIVDPKTQKKYNKQIEEALIKLKYGSIGFNCWAAVSYALYTTTWGPFPDDQVQSGIGVINNGYFFDYPEKSIVKAPFIPLLKPLWFYDHSNLINVAKNLVNFEYTQSISDFLKLSLSALKSK